MIDEKGSCAGTCIDYSFQVLSVTRKDEEASTGSCYKSKAETPFVCHENLRSNDEVIFFKLKRISKRVKFLQALA